MQINVNSRYSTSETVERASAISLIAAHSFEAQYEVSVENLVWLSPSATVYWFPAGIAIAVPEVVLMYPYFRLVATPVNTLRHITVTKTLTSTLALTVPSLTITGNDALTFTEDATIFEDFVVPVTQARKGSNNYPAFDETECAYAMPVSSPSHVLYINLQLPHKWKMGSTIYPHVHWIQARNELPVFKLLYRWIDTGVVVPEWSSAFTMNALIAAYPGGTVGQISNNLTGIAGTNHTLSSVLQVKLYRDDSAYGATLFLTSFDIHFESDGLGSRYEYIK